MVYPNVLSHKCKINSFIWTNVSSIPWFGSYRIPFITQHHTVIAHTKTLGLNYYIINIFIWRSANSMWSGELCKNGGESVKNWFKKWATQSPAVNCQIIQIAWIFEDPATCGLLFQANKEEALLKLCGAPTLIPNPTWLTVTTRHRGSLCS